MQNETRCGGHGEYYHTAYVKCRRCGARGPSFPLGGYYGLNYTDKDAVDAWNRRT